MTENTPDDSLPKPKKPYIRSIYLSGLGPPTPEEIEERTKFTKEIQVFAQRLVDDPIVNTALRRVGIGGELTSDEIDDINTRFELDKQFVFKVVTSLSLDRQAVVLSLARRIVAGKFPDASTPESFDYVFDRVFATTGNPKWQRRKRDVQVPFEVIYQVLSEYWNWLDTTKIKEVLRLEMSSREAEYEAANEPYNTDDLYAEIFEPIKLESQRLFRKYGFISEADVTFLQTVLSRDGKTIQDIKYIEKLAKKLSSYTRVMEFE